MLVPYRLVFASIVVASCLKMRQEELMPTPQAGEAGVRERQRATERPEPDVAQYTALHD